METPSTQQHRCKEMSDGRHGKFDGYQLVWSDGSRWRRVDEQRWHQDQPSVAFVDCLPQTESGRGTEHAQAICSGFGPPWGNNVCWQVFVRMK